MTMGRILVIDDEPNARKMMRMTLTKAGHTVDTADDGLQGLNQFGDGSTWDLTLVDQRMPGMDGRAVIHAIHKRAPTARIVMVTAFATADLAREVVEAGVMDFLRKPFNAMTLRHAVSAALSHPSRQDTAEDVPPPGTADGEQLVVPQVSHWLNGYRYWPISTPCTGSAPDIRRAFQVQGPFKESQVCVLGVMPHLNEQARAVLGEDLPPDDPVWDLICQSELTTYLWEQAQMPPSLLLIYELTSEQEQYLSKRASRR